MSDLFFNKVAAALLASALGFIVIHKIADSAVQPDVPSVKEFAYLPDIDLSGGETVEIEIPFPSAEWIAARDADKGKRIFAKCTSCHNADNGGANGTGPNLWNVVGAPAGQHAGFAYSSAMVDSGLTWSYENLDGYLENPKAFLPKNNMAFIGLKKEEDRAAVIEYLRQQADTPAEPLTEAAPIPGEELLEAALEDAQVDGDMIEKTGDVLDQAIDTSRDMAEDALEDMKEKAGGNEGGQ